jgi:hypothetical protein
MTIAFLLSWRNNTQWARTLINEALLSHSDTPDSVGLIWTEISKSQRPQHDNRQ